MTIIMSGFWKTYGSVRFMVAMEEWRMQHRERKLK